MLMAGLDGIQNKIDPGDPIDKNLYDLPPRELKKIPTVCGSLREALANLDKDRAFLKAGDVFSDDMIDAYIELRMEEVDRASSRRRIRSSSTCTIRSDRGLGPTDCGGAPLGRPFLLSKTKAPRTGDPRRLCICPVRRLVEDAGCNLTANGTFPSEVRRSGPSVKNRTPNTPAQPASPYAAMRDTRP